MRRVVSLIFLAVSMSACSTLDKSRPTMEADHAELGGEGIIYQNELSMAYEKYPGNNYICNNIYPSFQESDKWPYKRFSDGKKKDLTREYFRCMVFVKVKPGAEGMASIARHVQAGLALSDLYCRNYFSRLALHSRKRGFWRASGNDVGTAISAVLGLASVGAGTTAGVGVGFGLWDGFFRNYDESFLVGPDLAAVQKAVFSEQDRLKKATLATMPTNFADANMAIKAHADACSFVGMKRLINEKVTGGISSSRDDLVAYLARLKITQEDIDAAVSAQRAADAAAKEAAEKAVKDAEAAQSDVKPGEGNENTETILPTSAVKKQDDNSTAPSTDPAPPVPH